MRAARPAASGLLLGAFAGAAAAQGGVADITGRWCFQTEEYHSVAACSMSGELEIMAAGEDGAHVCSLRTEESCDVLDQPYRSRQACLARRDEASLRIESVVLSYSPAGGSYTPDNFTLRIENAARMTGAMQSPQNPAGPENAPVVFGRCGALVS